MTPAILKLANDCLKASPVTKTAAERDEFREVFLMTFLWGFTSPKSELQGGRDGGVQGHKAGQQYWRDHPEKIKTVFASYGYVAIEAEGVWTVGWETSLFRPTSRERSHERWWVKPLDRSLCESAASSMYSDEETLILASGFLSPLGEYGHMGCFDREFNITRALKATHPPKVTMRSKSGVILKMKNATKSNAVKSNSKAADPIAAYSKAQPQTFRTMCKLLRELIDTAIPKATSKVWHGSPVWFIDDNPVVGYNATKKSVNLLFWNGQALDEPGLKPVGKYGAAQAIFADAAEIDPKAIRRMLKKAKANVFDSKAFFAKLRASKKK